MTQYLVPPRKDPSYGWLKKPVMRVKCDLCDLRGSEGYEYVDCTLESWPVDAICDRCARLALSFAQDGLFELLG